MADYRGWKGAMLDTHDRSAPPGADLTSIWVRGLTRDLIHDVSSLLSGLGLAIETLDASAAGLLGDDDREAIRLAERNANRMRALITDGAEFHRFLDRHPLIEVQPFDLVTVLHDAVQAAKASAAIEARITCEDVVPAVWGDRALMLHVVAALLRSCSRPYAEGGARCTFVMNVRAIEGAVEVALHPDGAMVAASAALAREATVDTHGLVYRFARTAFESQGGRIEAITRPGVGRMLCFALPTAGSDLPLTNGRSC